MTTLRALMPYARRSQRREDAHERCELCGAAVAERHAHVVEFAQHALRCACTACAVLFRDAGSGGGRFRTVPERVRAIAALDAAPEAWARLEVPVELAFVVKRDQWVACYPSPAGPVEAPLSDAAAAALESLVPAARAVEREIEAILIHRRRGFVVPIDRCYELVGIVRKHWRGFDGGDEARAAIDEYLARIAKEAQ